jgi:dTDP-glucose 4,6-dehydratase
MDLAQKVKEVVAPNVTVEVAGKPNKSKLPERYVPSVERCKSELGLQVHISLPEAIRRTADCYTSLTHKEQKGVT